MAMQSEIDGSGSVINPSGLLNAAAAEAGREKQRAEARQLGQTPEEQAQATAKIDARVAAAAKSLKGGAAPRRSR